MTPIIACAMLLAAPPTTPAAPAPRLVPFKSDRPAREHYRGYYRTRHQGFTLFVSSMAYDRSDEAFGRPLKVITDELDRITEVFPAQSLAKLRKVSVWVEWDHIIPREVHAFAVLYQNDPERLSRDGVNSKKAGHICVLSLKTAWERHAKRGFRQNTLLHEFAHAVHYYAIGYENALVKNTYEQAVSRMLYADNKHDDGFTHKAYAETNEYEYFAELTCAYFDRLDYFPHDAKELRKHDSVGYELMEKVYGPLDKIAEQKRKERAAAKAAESGGPSITIISPPRKP